MWLCKVNKIHLLYLPPHASHLLQPLDLAPFSVLKSRYRNRIQALSALDNAAPIKKERFVVSYNKAREEVGGLLASAHTTQALYCYHPK